ncbi:MAG: hypothetical protein P8N01_07105, partial [Burkholderiales bacterium]|nr:hypothetical protein [Burkholderiales bacterium]
MFKSIQSLLFIIFTFFLFTFPLVGKALDREDISGLASEKVMDRLKSIEKIALVGDADSIRILEALQSSEVMVTNAGQIVLENDDWDVIDAITLEILVPQPDTYDTVVVNNRMRSQLESAIGSLQLFSQKRDVRLNSARALQDNLSPS